MKLNLEQYLQDSHTDAFVGTVKTVVQYLRFHQKQHLDATMEGVPSGISILKDMLQNGDITLSMFVKLYPWVENPMIPIDVYWEDGNVKIKEWDLAERIERLEDVEQKDGGRL